MREQLVLTKAVAASFLVPVSGRCHLMNPLPQWCVCLYPFQNSVCSQALFNAPLLCSVHALQEVCVCVCVVGPRYLTVHETRVGCQIQSVSCSVCVFCCLASMKQTSSMCCYCTLSRQDVCILNMYYSCHLLCMQVLCSKMRHGYRSCEYEMLSMLCAMLKSFLQSDITP